VYNTSFYNLIRSYILNPAALATSDSAKVAQSLTTRHHVRDLLNGPGRTFGREWFLTYLRTQFDYRARRLNVLLAQRQLDPKGVASRIPELRKVRL
jgi:hypothetical protein